MYNTLLYAHSWMRWVVLFILLLAIIRAYRGWMRNDTFTSTDNSLRTWTILTIHIQFLLSIALFFVSPITKQFMNNFSTSVKDTMLRFFSMEHSLMMLVAIIVITIGGAKARRKVEDTAKFKTMAIWFTIGLLIILVAIPWPFLEDAKARMLFRF